MWTPEELGSENIGLEHVSSSRKLEVQKAPKAGAGEKDDDDDDHDHDDDDDHKYRGGKN